MEIQGKNALVLGGYGLVGAAVCRELIRYEPARLVVSSLKKDQAEEAVTRLRDEYPGSNTEFLPAYGDILLRAEWQSDGGKAHPRVAVLSDIDKRRRLVADILDELDVEILESSLLFQLITGKIGALRGHPADIIVDCVNTATAVAYQNIYENAHSLEARIAEGEEADWTEEIEHLLASLYIPQLVRHMQIFYRSMLEAKTQAYVKVGTSGTGGMGFNIPYTHGEERPSRVLLSKSAVGGSQTMLLFLLARTPGGPQVVKEVKPTAGIAWKAIDYGTIKSGGQAFDLYDCLPGEAYSLEDPSTLEPRGEFGTPTGKTLESVYIDTGENGFFSVGEFTALTTIGQMAFVTPEEIAENVVDEIRGRNTGKDVIAALDAAVMGPSYRAGFMRQAALNRLRQLEEEHHTDSVAFEMLGPPRLSKLLFEAYLFKRVCKTMANAISGDEQELSEAIYGEIQTDADLRQAILSIGIPVLVPDGDTLLRGPVIKSADADNGWVDLTPGNVERWQARFEALSDHLQQTLEGDSSSLLDRSFPASRRWDEQESFDIGEIVGWIFTTEDNGRRGKW